MVDSYTEKEKQAMSAKMKEIVEVIKEVQESFRSCPDASIRKLRIAAVEKVAKKREIDIRTVYDKFTRKLDMNSLSEVDRLLDEWLRNGTKELENILRYHYYFNGKELEPFSKNMVTPKVKAKNRPK